MPTGGTFFKGHVIKARSINITREETGCKAREDRAGERRTVGKE
jgi:hypothetical protein